MRLKSLSNLNSNKESPNSGSSGNKDLKDSEYNLKNQNSLHKKNQSLFCPKPYQQEFNNNPNTNSNSLINNILPGRESTLPVKKTSFTFLSKDKSIKDKPNNSIKELIKDKSPEKNDKKNNNQQNKNNKINSLDIIKNSIEQGFLSKNVKDINKTDINENKFNKVLNNNNNNTNNTDYFSSIDLNELTLHFNKKNRKFDEEAELIQELRFIYSFFYQNQNYTSDKNYKDHDKNHKF